MEHDISVQANVNTDKYADDCTMDAAVRAGKIRPVHEYCSPVWGGLPKYSRDEVEHVQRRSLRIIRLPYRYLTTLEKRRDEAAMRYRDTIRKDPNRSLYQHTICYKS